MDAIRRVVGIVSGFGLALAVSGSASAQYDMLPYQPYTGQYRTSGFPADQALGGYFNLPPTPAPRFSGSSFADRVDADLDGDISGVKTKADRKVEQDRTLRDRYYREAQQSKNPAERARMMRMYRDEDRRLSRELAIRPNGSAIRATAGDESSRSSGRRRSPSASSTTRGAAGATVGGARGTAPVERSGPAAVPAGRSTQRGAAPSTGTSGGSAGSSNPAPR